jgi:2-amino-4-hydroxy-6-hydroxymethyldihydropteridine diphosphokinase / dihydropteroate synthase
MSPLTFLHPSAPPLSPLSPTKKPLIMSILNMTPDSFSDGGLHNTLDKAGLTCTISDMFSSGADIIDIGGESTRPGSTPLSPAEELARVLPAISIASDIISERYPGKTISIDTYHATTASAALDAGANIINDISGGLLDPAILTVASRRNAPIILGHIRGTPQTMTLPQHTAYSTSDSTTIPDIIANELAQRLRAAQLSGIRRWRTLLDPGFGFAKTYPTNLALLTRFSQLRDVAEMRGIPWTVGLSRKRFVQRLANGGRPVSDLLEAEKKRLMEQGTAEALAKVVSAGADVIRVHDIRQGIAAIRTGRSVS